MRKPMYAVFIAMLFLIQMEAQAAVTGSGSKNGPQDQLAPLDDSLLLLAKRGGKHRGGDDDDDGGHPGRGKGKKKWKNKGDDDDGGHPGRGRGRGRGRGNSKYDYHSKDWRPYHNKRLPKWAQDCGLPPGLAKQNKIPPGWEKKCRKGYRYYEHEEEFRRDVDREYQTQKGGVDKNSPAYKTVYALDDADCKVRALKEAGSIAEGAAKGAVFGGVLGAATGILIESAQKDGNVENGAIYGATGGAAGGAVLGGVLASDGYKNHYRKCMRKRGHRAN